MGVPQFEKELLQQEDNELLASSSFPSPASQRSHMKWSINKDQSNEATITTWDGHPREFAWGHYATDVLSVWSNIHHNSTWPRYFLFGKYDQQQREMA